MILALAAMHLASGSGTSGVEIVAWIVIPVAIFLFGATIAGIKGIVKFSQWLAHAQETQDSGRDSLESIANNLKEYTEKSDLRFGNIEKDVAVLKSWRGRGHANDNREGGWN